MNIRPVAAPQPATGRREGAVQKVIVLYPAAAHGGKRTLLSPHKAQARSAYVLPGIPRFRAKALPTRRSAAPYGWVIPLPACRPFTPLSLLAGDAGLQL